MSWDDVRKEAQALEQELEALQAKRKKFTGDDPPWAAQAARVGEAFQALRASFAGPDLERRMKAVDQVERDVQELLRAMEAEPLRPLVRRRLRARLGPHRQLLSARLLSAAALLYSLHQLAEHFRWPGWISSLALVLTLALGLLHAVGDQLLGEVPAGLP